MGPESNNPPLVVIVGETASGKTALAIELAKQFNGEIIAADSRTIYRDLDIGTAKPTLDERREVPHHIIDVVTPDQPFTVADFKKRAVQAIAEIASRRHVPMLVGGTGLYVDAVIYDFTFGPLPDAGERARLLQLSVPELQAILAQRTIPLPENAQNPRHLIRAIETGGVVRAPNTLRPNTLLLGLTIDRDELDWRLRQRVATMLGHGLLNEARQAAEKYGWESGILQTIGYKELRPYFAGEVSLAQAEQNIIHDTERFAKRQRTWFKRNKSIHWISEQAEAVDLVTTFLNK